MNEALAFHLDSPWCLILVTAAPVLFVGMYILESHSISKWHAYPNNVDGPDHQLYIVLAVMFSALSLVVGSGLSLWVLLATDQDPSKHPLFLTGLTMLALAVWIFCWTWWRQRHFRPVVRYPCIEVFSRLFPNGPTKMRVFPIIMRITAFVLLVFALARPQVATTEPYAFTEGMDIVFALDVSTSMRAVDFASTTNPSKPISRIGGAKEVITNFIRQRKHDRLGLVVFAEDAYTQCPLTLDYPVLENILKSVKTGVIRDGTAIGNAMLVSVNRLIDSDTKSKVIILLTDGYENASKVAPEQAAQIAARQNIQVFTILVGKGGLVPYPIGPDSTGRMKYRPTKIPTDPDLLKRIAAISKSKFYRAMDQEALEKDLLDILDHMEKSRLMDPGRAKHQTDMFHLALLPAFFILSAQLVLSWTKFRKLP